MKQVKKVFNVEYDLTSDEFKATKQDMISEKCQNMHPDYICKVTTFCVPDKQLVVATTEENRSFMGASDKLLAHRPLAEQSFMNLDDDMVKTYEITITADTDLPDYLTAIDVAQAKADEMFEADDSKLPLVTVIDYRWGNEPTTLSASVFGDVDADGNTVPLVNGTAPINVSGGNSENGKKVLGLSNSNIVNSTEIIDNIISSSMSDIDAKIDSMILSSMDTFIDGYYNNQSGYWYYEQSYATIKFLKTTDIYITQSEAYPQYNGGIKLTNEDTGAINILNNFPIKSYEKIITVEAGTYTFGFNGKAQIIDGIIFKQ